MPEVKSKVDVYIKTLERAERVSGKTAKAAQILGAREPTVLRAGEKALAAGEKEAGVITAEAKKRVDKILGDKNPADAVRQIMSDRASSGLVSSVRTFREDVAPSLRQAGLMSDSQLASLEAQLQSIANSAIGEPAKLTMLQNAIKNAIIGVAAPLAGKPIVSGGKSLYDVINRPKQATSPARTF